MKFSNQIDQTLLIPYTAFMDLIVSDPSLIEVISVLGRKIRTTEKYLTYIATEKHTELLNKVEKSASILLALSDADNVYQKIGEDDDGVYLYYRNIGRYTICVISRHLNGDGFVITAYLTTKMKRKGTLIWHK